MILDWHDAQECIDLLLKQPPKHVERGKVLRFLHQKEFAAWKAELLSGFSVLLTGFGSKYNLLGAFLRHALRGEKCLVVEGFNPAFSVIQLVNTLCDSYFFLNHDSMRQDVLVALGSRLHRSSKKCWLVVRCSRSTSLS